ncbi:hypothetical protein TNCV_76671 [Trichonephila clavipes]|nr:hypothetical protein TNCV_76671 [Trichonephila clavipes]
MFKIFLQAKTLKGYDLKVSYTRNYPFSKKGLEGALKKVRRIKIQVDSSALSNKNGYVNGTLSSYHMNPDFACSNKIDESVSGGIEENARGLLAFNTIIRALWVTSDGMGSLWITHTGGNQQLALHFPDLRAHPPALSSRRRRRHLSTI